MSVPFLGSRTAQTTFRNEPSGYAIMSAICTQTPNPYPCHHSSPCSQQIIRQGLNTLIQDQAPKILLATNVQHSVFNTGCAKAP